MQEKDELRKKWHNKSAPVCMDLWDSSSQKSNTHFSIGVYDGPALQTVFDDSCEVCDLTL